MFDTFSCSRIVHLALSRNIIHMPPKYKRNENKQFTTTAREREPLNTTVHNGENTENEKMRKWV